VWKKIQTIWPCRLKDYNIWRAKKTILHSCETWSKDFEPSSSKKNSLNKNKDLTIHKYMMLNSLIKKFQKQIWNLVYSKLPCNAKRLNELAIYLSFFDEFLYNEETLFFKSKFWKVRDKHLEYVGVFFNYIIYCKIIGLEVRTKCFFLKLPRPS